MRHSFGLRAALMALTVALVGLGLSSSARADSGTITFRVLKGGWFIGASGGSGTLFFHGRRYPLSIGGLSVGLVFGGSETYFQGTVTNIRSPYDVTDSGNSDSGSVGYFMSVTSARQSRRCSSSTTVVIALTM